MEERRKLGLVLVFSVLVLAGLACSLPGEFLGTGSSGGEDVEAQIEATFQARTQQAASGGSSGESSGGSSGGGDQDTATPYSGDSSSGSLAAGGTIRGVDGVAIGASDGSLQEPVEVTITRIEKPETKAQLGVEKVGDYYHISAGRSLQSQSDAPLFIALPVPQEESFDNLGMALLGQKDEFHVDPQEDSEDHEPAVEDSWVFRTAAVDQEDRLLVATFFTIPENGRTFTIVKDDSLSPSLPSQSSLAGLAKPVQADQGPAFKAICHPKAFDNVNWKCTKRDREAAATLLENAYNEHRNLGFKKPNLYYGVKVVSSMPQDVPNTDTGVRQYTMSIADCTWMSNKWGNGTIGKYFGAKGPKSLQVCYNGNNVNWRGGSATSANWVEKTVYHEYFHATQWAYQGFRRKHQGWSVEGMARASENSAQSMKRGPGGWHDLDVALSKGSQKYRAQDFWVFIGQEMNRGLDYLIPFLKQGANAETVDKVLQNTYGNAYPSGLSSAYWTWIKNQAFENGAGGQCGLNENAVTVAGNEHALMTSTVTGSTGIKVGPLESKVIRYNIFRISDSPAVKYQYTLRADQGATEAHSKFYFQYEENSNQCVSRPDRSKVFAVEVPRGAEFVDHYALIANGMHDLETQFKLSVTPHKYQVDIVQPSSTISVTQGNSQNFRAVFSKDGSDQNSGQIKWTVGNPLSLSGNVVATGSSVNISSGQLGGVGTHKVYANYTGNPPREMIYDVLTVSVSAADAPSVNITHPSDGDLLQSEYYGGSYEHDDRNRLLFTATGTATDDNGDSLAGSSLEWFYRCEGCSSWNSAGTGQSADFKLQDRQCGPTGYQLRLQATDSFGNTAQDVINISVNVTGC